MGQEDSMQSLEGILIMALIDLDLIRAERAVRQSKNILNWSYCITVLCFGLFAVACRLQVRLSPEEMAWLGIASLIVPRTFGFFLSIRVLQRVLVLHSEENGLRVMRILDSIAEMSPSYASTFIDLLNAVMDNDGARAVSLAEELDVHRSSIKEFTTLVREAFG